MRCYLDGKRTTCSVMRWLLPVLALVVGLLAIPSTAGAATKLVGVTGGVALWHRHDNREHPDLWPGIGEDVSLASYVERHSFPGDSVSDFVTSKAGSVSLEEARRIAEAFNAGQAPERFDAYMRRNEAARRDHGARR